MRMIKAVILWCFIASSGLVSADTYTMSAAVVPRADVKNFLAVSSDTVSPADALIIFDDAAPPAKYGLFPFRGIIRTGLAAGPAFSNPEEFFSFIDSRKSASPGTIIIPAVEFPPYFRWGGGILSGIRLFDRNHRIIVAGLQSPDDIKRLPAVGNMHGGHFSPVGLWPLLFLPAWWYFRRKNHRKTALATAVAAGVLLLAGFPFIRYSYSEYAAVPDWRSYREADEYARQHKMAFFWSRPTESSDGIQISSWPSIRLFSLACPEAVKNDVHSGGIAVLPSDTPETAGPGGWWDKALDDVVKQYRDSIPFGFAGPAPDVRMVVSAREKSAAGIVDALRAGDFYSLRQDSACASVSLSTWSLSSSGYAAFAGQTLYYQLPEEYNAADAIRAPVLPDVHIELASSSPCQAVVNVIRDGNVISSQAVSLPYSVTFKDDKNMESASVYRLAVTWGERGRIYSNPIVAISR